MNDRPPIRSILARETGEPRVWGCDHANPGTCDRLIAENVPGDSAIRYTDAWQRDRGSHTTPATVGHGVHDWAREDAGDGRREVHGHTCEAVGAALRTYRRVFRGVHQQDLHLDVAAYEATVHAKRVTPELIRRMGGRNPSVHTGYT